jgi:hypothetical protein
MNNGGYGGGGALDLETLALLAFGCVLGIGLGARKNRRRKTRMRLQHS